MLCATGTVEIRGRIDVSGFDGKTRAIDARNGKLRWQFKTPSAIRIPPTIADGRLFVRTRKSLICVTNQSS